MLGGNMKIAITTESTVDLPKELLEKYDIKTVPFMVLLGENEYKDGEIGSKEIFEFVDKNKVLPKTSAVNGEQYREFWTEILKTYDAIVHVTLSSEMSSAWTHAVETANEMKNVYVVDSKSLSTGIALLAINGRKYADKGMSAEEIAKKLEERVPKVQASFVLKKLEYLYKGGRCSALAYFGANLFQLRPQILVKNGKMGANKKYRGNMEKVVPAYCKDTLAEFNTPDLSLAFVTYTTATEQMIESAKSALRERGFKEIYATTAGGTISSHCGENTLGILYMNDGDQN